MLRRTQPIVRNRAPSHHNTLVRARRSRRAAGLGKRARGESYQRRGPFVPPEDWYEPTERSNSDYRIVVQPPGPGYRHVVTPEEIRARLALLPGWMLQSLEVVQLSRMTRKKKTFPCYGMQWGNALYLYPIETSLVEYYVRPPMPAERNEAIMYGGRWVQEDNGSWKLIWTEEAIRDFYLHNILMHELGHLLDDRNTSYTDRERYAEWFALEHGYKPMRRKRMAQRATQRIVRRHHAC